MWGVFAGAGARRSAKAGCTARLFPHGTFNPASPICLGLLMLYPGYSSDNYDRGYKRPVR